MAGRTDARSIFAAVTVLSPALLASALVLLVPRVAHSQDAGSTDIGQEAAAALLQRLDALERRNQQLEQEVSDLQSESGDRWLTQERAAEIRTIVTDVLADADARTSLQSDQMTAGWNDGFFLSSPDGRFALKIGGMLQTRFIWSQIPNSGRTTAFGAPLPGLDSERSRSGFDLGQSELWFTGHAFSPDITFKMRVAASNENSIFLLDQNANFVGGSSSGTMQILDAWVRLAMDDAWSVRAGQFKLPYSRETLIQQQYTFGVARSVIDYHLGLGYSQGVELEYVDPEYRMRVSVNDGAQDYLGGNIFGIAGGQDPMGKPWSYSGNPAFAGRFEWKPIGAWKQFESITSPIGDERGLLFGLGWHWQQQQPYLYPDTDPETSGLDENTWISLTADATYMLGGASLFVSGYFNNINAQTALINTGLGLGSDPTADLGTCYFYGAVVQGGYYFDTDLEGYARFEWGEYDIGNMPTTGPWESLLGDSSPLMLMTIGANWYIDGEDVKWTTDIGYAFDEVDPAWQTLPAGWRLSGRNECVFRTVFQLMF
ncbi:MAG: porin [Planctomycetota bacterium]|nr:porin [Planctomycetota bacterium]MDA1106677.1 porin [Planctomycetota bacterium]